MLQVGLLGAGFIGKTHAAAFARLEGVRLAAVASTSQATAEALAEQYARARLIRSKPSWTTRHCRCQHLPADLSARLRGGGGGRAGQAHLV